MDPDAGRDRTARIVVATRRLSALTETVEARLDLPHGPLLVALSGGADSASLAWIVARRRLPIRLAHIHHGLPGSDMMEEAAAAIAKDLDLPLEVRRLSLQRFTEGAARDARYQAFESIRAAGEWILTGHTSDDQAETVLLNLLRGAGVDGLAGIPPRRGHIARPLLAVSRAETRELATLAGLPWADDPSNVDLGPLRNRIRYVLIPQLEAEYNPSLRRHLFTAALALSDVAASRKPIGEAAGDGWRAAAGELWAMGRSGAITALRAIVANMRSGYGLDRAEAERVWAVIDGQAKGAELSGGLRVSRFGPWLEITAQRHTEANGP
jgi:tRNA(Ile)-lysidine synthase